MQQEFLETLSNLLINATREKHNLDNCFNDFLNNAKI